MSVSTISGDFGADLDTLIRAYEAEGHSVFRPSSAARWMTCAGSVLAEIQAQADRAGYDAAYGTVAHSIAEMRLRTGRFPDWASPGNTVEERGFVISIDDEMLSYVMDYVEWCDELGSGDVTAIETRVDFSDLTPVPNQGGTADHIHIKDGVLTITDLKFGTGVRVHARGNKQARLYAYGALREWEWAYNIHTIVIRICQPRLEVFDTWQITRDELLTFAAEAKVAAHRAWQPNAPRTPHPDACRFCSVSATCAAKVKLAEAIADDVFDNLDEMQVDAETVSVPDAVIGPRSRPGELSTEELARVLRWRGLFDAWFRDVHDELLARTNNGQKAPGWKVVEGITKRAWTDEYQAAAMLSAVGVPESKLYTKKLISPKQASDMLRVRKIDAKSVLAPFITKPPGKRSLVVEEDSREDIQSAGDDVFDDLA